MRRLLPALMLILAACGRPAIDARTGPEVYAATCGTCHGADGLGVNEAFPPLKGSSWVALPDSLLIRLTLRGLQGPIRVGDADYNNVMPPHNFLTDAQLAAVLTFVRSEFGSGGSAISAEQVARERPRFGSGPMWTIQELTAPE